MEFLVNNAEKNQQQILQTNVPTEKKVISYLCSVSEDHQPIRIDVCQAKTTTVHQPIREDQCANREYQYAIKKEHQKVSQDRCVLYCTSFKANV